MRSWIEGFEREQPVTQKLMHVSWPLVVLATLLSGLGVATLYSVAGGSFAPWADKQLLRYVGGLALLLAVAVLPLRLWMGLAWPSYLAAVALLVAVLALGTVAMGARRWLQLGPLSIQPAELVKFGLVLALARYYQWLEPRRIARPLWVLVPFLMSVIPALLVIRQPDLGSGLLILLLGLGMMFLAGVPLAYFAGGALTAGVVAPFVYTFLHDYQRRRITSFLNPEQDPMGAGYHVTQSKIALGSGGPAGKGYLQGSQGAVNLLPERHTDFAFASLGEELGFVGTLSVLVLFSLVLLVLGVMALRCRSQFARLLIGGVGLALFLHVFVNIAMVTGLLPVVGVPLPLISYGGSSMLSTLFGLGLACCAYVNRERMVRPELVRFA